MLSDRSHTSQGPCLLWGLGGRSEAHRGARERTPEGNPTHSPGPRDADSLKDHQKLPLWASAAPAGKWACPVVPILGRVSESLKGVLQRYSRVATAGFWGSGVESGNQIYFFSKSTRHSDARPVWATQERHLEPVPILNPRVPKSKRVSSACCPCNWLTPCTTHKKIIRYNSFHPERVRPQAPP